ncbi:MAG: PH domain-containing protein [Pyrinomonadaceae bacterium MAG19_C2-C3]|nr:PH domain-containing protein [Pyrinomonadaceae bacterium MAG19_C2-C3]
MNLAARFTLQPVQHTTRTTAADDADHQTADSTTYETTLYQSRKSLINNRAARKEADVVFTARPALRRVRLWVVIYGALLMLVLGGYYVTAYMLAPAFYSAARSSSYDPVMLHLFGAMLAFIPAAGLFATPRVYIALAHTRYTVTTEHVEVAGGMFSRGKHSIPLAAIRDVSSFATLDQRLLGVGNVTVLATNGHGITLQDVTDYEAKREAIWHLVRK